MADYQIKAELRSVVGKKVKRLRKAGLVPITIYGPKIDPVNLQVVYRPLEVALMHAGGTNLIDINVEGGKTHVVLAREVQRDVVRGDILHVDFFAIDANTVIRADVPIHLVGESRAVAAREGMLLAGTNTVTIEALPDKLMDSIEVDLSQLRSVGDSIHVSDLKLDEGIIVINDPDEMIARVAQTSAARAELLEELDSITEATSAEPEVIARGKDDDDE